MGVHSREMRPALGATSMGLNQRSVTELCRQPDVLIDAFRACRARSIALAAPLSAEDQLIQSMPDASPTKWHLAHTTWFFETFILAEYASGHRWYAPEFRVLYNSYYNGIGEQHPRARRGMISRPSLEQVHDYRARIDQRLEKLLKDVDQTLLRKLAPLMLLGINHEQQHQELMVTDVKHALAQNPSWPAYLGEAAAQGEAGREALRPATGTFEWIEVPGGEYRIGHDGAGFAFDNEGPAHEILLGNFAIANRPVSNGDWLTFMADDGYGDPLLWLADGWAWREAEGVKAPLYWRRATDGDWRQFTLRGERSVDPALPVAHISGYEADAFARWADARLPAEAEWETAVRSRTLALETLEEVGDPATGVAEQEFQTVWEWTSSAYAPYPGFRPAGGAVGEYNGKFMINQLVLRGASSATAPGHARPSYRNFFYPAQRWQYSGLRLAHDT